jgi:hypothetical protein
MSVGPLPLSKTEAEPTPRGSGGEAVADRLRTEGGAQHRALAVDVDSGGWADTSSVDLPQEPVWRGSRSELVSRVFAPAPVGRTRRRQSPAPSLVIAGRRRRACSGRKACPRLRVWRWEAS